MYTKLCIALLFLLAAAPSANGAQPDVEEMYQSARVHYYSLFNSQEKMEDRGHWLLVIDQFDNIAITYPGTKRGADAHYTTGLLYQKLYYRSGKQEDRKSAIDSFSKVIQQYPQSSLVDDAEQHIGDIRFRDSDYQSARDSYKSVEQRRIPKKSYKGKTVKTVFSKTRNTKLKPKVSTDGRSFQSNTFTQLREIKRFSRSGYTRLILFLSRRTAYRAVELSNPERVFIDLLGTRPKSGFPDRIRYNSGIVANVRMGKNDSSITRVVFDLTTESSYMITSLENPFRIVIDFSKGKRRFVDGGKAPSASNTLIKVQPRKYKRKPALIVIDPGHGGRDPGAIGPSGLKEKTVTLAIARKLKASLERKYGYRVVLTRNSDRFIELDERTVIANSMKADLFVSIHVNSSPYRSARGLETYFLSPARSKDELATAARENMIAAHSDNPVENDLAYIMSDLSSTRKVNDSVMLAKSVQSHMVKGMRANYRGIKDKGVKQAMFYVLWRASMPSVLVETSFISNKEEERLLRNALYIEKLAESIARGVSTYSKTALGRPDTLARR